MAYLRAYQAKGDPFLGGLIKGIGRAVGGVARNFLGLGGPATQVVMPGMGKIGAKAGQIVSKFPGGKKGAAIAAGALGAGALGGMMGGMMGGAPRRKHRTVIDVTALRRAMNRVDRFTKLAKRTMTFTHTHRMKRRRRK